MTNKVRGSVIDWPQASASIPISTDYPAGTVAFNTGSEEPIGWKFNGTIWQPFGSPYIEFSTSFDPPSIAALGYSSSTQVVPGAVFGDFVSVSLSVSQAGVHLIGYVSAEDRVSISIFNATGSSVNIPACTLFIRVEK